MLQLLSVVPFPPQGSTCLNFPPSNTLLPTLPLPACHYGSTLFDVALSETSMAGLLFDRMMKDARLKESIALSLVQNNKDVLQQVVDALNICSGSVNELLGSDKF